MTTATAAARATTTATASKVHFGISLPNRAVLFGYPPRLLLETAKAVETYGCFDSLWVGDNLLSRPRLESIVLLSALAVLTERVKLGTIAFASFPLRHPIPLAIQWASLDLLSGGRTIFAVAIGGAASRNAITRNELETMGVRSVDRVARMEEGIEVLRKAWGPGLLSHHGRFYDFEGAEVVPKPCQPRVPIPIAVNPLKDAPPEVEERALRRVARLGDGWQSDETAPEIFGERWRRIRAYAAEYGRENECTDAAYHMMVNINEDAEAAFEESSDFLDRYYGVGRFSNQDARRRWLAWGSPALVAEKIQSFLDAGCTTMVVRFTGKDQMGQLDRFANEVMPAFQQVAAPLKA